MQVPAMPGGDRTVWKFAMPRGAGLAHILMPRGAQILDVAFQGDMVHLWALVERGVPSEERVFQVVGTGHDVSDELQTFLKTLHINGYVFHIFERHSS